MKKRKLPPPKDLWARHEEHVLEVFALALKMLYKERKDLTSECENRLNASLSVKTRKANLQLAKKGRGLNCSPTWEAQNQPQTEDDIDADWTRTKPDFQCELFDPNQESVETAYRSYMIECKRLGRPLKNGRKLNEKYIQNGVLRFLNAQHSYGKGAESGAMIGYIQNMKPNEILSEVNQCIVSITDHKIPSIKFPNNGFDENPILRTTQPLKRTKVLPSLFDLQHLWVDLQYRQS